MPDDGKINTPVCYGQENYSNLARMFQIKWIYISTEAWINQINFNCTQKWTTTSRKLNYRPVNCHDNEICNVTFSDVSCMCFEVIVNLILITGNAFVPRIKTSESILSKFGFVQVAEELEVWIESKTMDEFNCCYC